MLLYTVDIYKITRPFPVLKTSYYFQYYFQFIKQLKHKLIIVINKYNVV